MLSEERPSRLARSFAVEASLPPPIWR